jgi:hypothetical protein
VHVVSVELGEERRLAVLLPTLRLKLSIDDILKIFRNRLHATLSFVPVKCRTDNEISVKEVYHGSCEWLIIILRLVGEGS